MKLTEEYKIAEAFLLQPWKKLTYADVYRISGKKSKGYIYKSLGKLLNEKIIEKENVGKSILYNLNLNSLKSRYYLGILNEYRSWKMAYVPHKIIENISKKIKTPFFILIVTGSYAKQKQNKNSDLDIAVICDDTLDTKSIYASIKLESDLSIPKVHPFVFTRKEFVEMLTNDEFNYGKEIARYNLIFYGAEQYYTILNEGIKHGFRG